MASIFDEKEENLWEGQRNSLLEILEDRNRTLNKKGLLHRMVVISKMYHNNFDEISRHYDRFFKEKQAVMQCEAVTGLLLCYPKHCVHVIESCNEMLVEMAKELQHEAECGEGHMEKSKILIVSHDIYIPNRLYQNWSTRVLDIEAPRLEEYESTESAERMVLEMLTQLLKLGLYLSKHQKVGQNNLHEQVPEHLPQQAVLGYLLENDDSSTESVMNVEEYLDIYGQPYDVVLNSELTWPMPIRLFPYN